MSPSITSRDKGPADLVQSWFGAEGLPLSAGAAPSAGASGGVARIRHESVRDAESMSALYEPLCTSEVELVAHLGQSVDGFVAGRDGQSRGLSSAENIVHLHRLRALFDAVVVGGRTARSDDPRLTTRLVPGPSPVRVVVDPFLRCPADLRVFVDGKSPTIVVCAADAPPVTFGKAVRVLRLEQPRSQLSMGHVASALRREGLGRLFVEGGGALVSRCLTEGLLQRLHITIAPVFIGSGVRGVLPDGIRRFQDAQRPACRRFTMGSDILFDFDLTRQRGGVGLRNQEHE